MAEYLNMSQLESDIVHVELHKQINRPPLISIDIQQLSNTIKPPFFCAIESTWNKQLTAAYNLKSR